MNDNHTQAYLQGGWVEGERIWGIIQLAKMSFSEGFGTPVDRKTMTYKSATVAQVAWWTGDTHRELNEQVTCRRLTQGGEDKKDKRGLKIHSQVSKYPALLEKGDLQRGVQRELQKGDLEKGHSHIIVSDIFSSPKLPFSCTGCRSQWFLLQ